MSENVLTRVTAQEQLRNAAALIEEHGHATGMYVGPNGEMCLAMALAKAGGTKIVPANPIVVSIPDQGELEASPAMLALGKNLAEICDINNYGHVVGWDGEARIGAAPPDARRAAGWLRTQADLLDRKEQTA